MIVFSTSDWDELAKKCQRDWTECLKINKAAKFGVIRTDLYVGGGGGGKFVPPTIQMCVQFHEFDLYSLWTYNLKTW